MKNGVLYAVLNNMVIRSVDKGVTWSDYTDSTSGSLVALPNSINFFEIISDSTQNNESVYVVSANSVYYRNNTMTGWMLFMNNLPTTGNFTDIDIFLDPSNVANNRLRLATFGRGLWETVPASNAILPVVFMGLSVSAGNNGNTLIWKTAQETDLLHFEIEKSTDGRNFVYTGKVLANGNSSTISSYSFVDPTLFVENGVFYKIKIIENNGTVTYSNIVFVHKIHNRQNALAVVNNPSNNTEVKLLISVTQKQNATVVVYDMNGSQILQKPLALEKGGQVITLTNVLSTGVYVVKLELGHTVLSKQFIKD